MFFTSSFCEATPQPAEIQCHAYWVFLQSASPKDRHNAKGEEQVSRTVLEPSGPRGCSKIIKAAEVLVATGTFASCSSL